MRRVEDLRGRGSQESHIKKMDGKGQERELPL